MSVTMKVSWKKRAAHIKGYDEKRNVVFDESFTAPTKRAFREKVQEKLREYAVVGKESTDIA